MYLWPLSSDMSDMKGGFGVMSTPGKWAVEVGVKQGRLFAIDNGAFKGFSPEKYLRRLQVLLPWKKQCLFVSVPDKVGDAAATRSMWDDWHEQIGAYGYSLAFVAQDEATIESIPWGECEWLFIGGTNAFKLGEEAASLIRYAKSIGKYVHVGRVNSQKRFRYFAELGADSCDGTSAAFEPDIFRKRISVVVGDSPLSLSNRSG